MITSAIIPRPLARLPWRLIFLVAGIALFGLIVLYSAAGGSIRPWALKQSIIFMAFLALAMAMSWLSESTIKAMP
jgi:rod shape determining protein RodA